MHNTSAPARAMFRCSKCKHEYDWSKEMVGKTARCSCGQVLRVPVQPHTPQGSAAPARFAVGTPQNPSFVPSSMAVPSMGTLASALAQPEPIPAASAAGITRTIHSGDNDEPLDPSIERELSAGGLIQKEGAELAYNDFRDRQFPLWLLGGGCALIIGQIVLASHLNPALSLIGATIGVTVAVVINVALMFAGVLVAAKFAGISFGPLGQALLKLSAIYVGPTAIGELVTHFLGGDIAVQCLGWGVSMFLYYCLIHYLFCLDGAQTVICVTAILVVRLIAVTLLSMFLVALVAHTINNEVNDLGELQAEQVADIEEE